MRIKEMITNLRSIDLQMNSLFQYHKKHTKNSMENMDTDVRVSRVKHLHIQWYNTCTLLEIGCLGEVETFNWLLHNIMERWWWWWWYLWCKLTKWMLYDDQIKSLLIITLCNLLWTLRKENNKYVIDPLSQWTAYCNHRRESWLAKYPLKWSGSVVTSFSTSAYIL